LAIEKIIYGMVKVLLLPMLLRGRGDWGNRAQYFARKLRDIIQHFCVSVLQWLSNFFLPELFFYLPVSREHPAQTVKPDI